MVRVSNQAELTAAVAAAAPGATILLAPGVTGICRDNVAPFYEVNAKVQQSGNRRGWPI